MFSETLFWLCSRQSPLEQNKKKQMGLKIDGCADHAFVPTFGNALLHHDGMCPLEYSKSSRTSTACQRKVVRRMLDHRTCRIKHAECF